MRTREGIAECFYYESIQPVIFKNIFNSREHFTYAITAVIASVTIQLRLIKNLT